MPGRHSHLRLSSLFSSPKVIPCAVFYGSGIGFLFLSCLGSAHVQGLHATSWTDGFSLPLVLVSLVLCLIGPLIAPCRIRDRITLVLAGLGGFVVAFGICAFIYTSLVTGQHASEQRAHAMTRMPTPNRAA